MLHFVGDLNQAIYEFKRVNLEQVIIFAVTRKFSSFSLSDNFRSCRPIIDICHKIVENRDLEKSKYTQFVEKPCICVVYTEEQMHLLPLWFSEQIGQVSCDRDKSAIVARNWNNVSRLRPSSNTIVRGPQMGLAMSIYLWESQHYQAVDDALKYMRRFFSDKCFLKYSPNPRHYYCPECLDSYLLCRLFLSKVLNYCCANNSQILDLNQIWSNWVQSVRTQFGEIARECFPIIENSITGTIPEFADLTGNTFKTPSNAEGKNVLETLPSIS